MPQSELLNVCLKISGATLSEALQELLPQAGISVKNSEQDSQAILYTGSRPESALFTIDFLSFNTPIKFFDLLAHLENLPYQQEIKFAHFLLDVREKNLKNQKTQEMQRMTEKEVQLLRFFHQHQGQDIPKDKLLKEIWGYHPDAETHTLETHIYRLRQKLEEDPNEPAVLLNGKEGYLIAA